MTFIITFTSYYDYKTQTIVVDYYCGNCNALLLKEPIEEKNEKLLIDDPIKQIKKMFEINTLPNICPNCGLNIKNILSEKTKKENK